MRFVTWLLFLMLGAAVAAEPRRSGYETMSPALQQMQRDDASNPAMLSVQEGQVLWQQWNCARCHGEAGRSLRGVAARYPAFDAALGRPLNLAQRIQQCRRRDGAPVPASDSEALLSLTAFVALQSRGQPIAPPDDARLAPFVERGRALFERRIGQLNLSCAQCHEQRAGQKLGGSLIPQGHPTGYPLYRLEWQALGSLQRRLRNCASGVRAEPWALDAPELVELELYLMRRAAGMAMDAPALRP
ncbi:sulfur oxidation c-type cytochrome SoxA [Roseateles violae]|uniref:L-cysteine S-thiosulfotransferase subunit SoxA n=1 Tax=Roseateles violae TaxID=3058042 RepID=A0ABT8DVK8_9BURK|nr:sulfur oxidation c-type cytochrome SoxA [Pelomonas sp. PFR6]MDN3920417.1 sulfur oxidation c-type cytochrome SoxA [Pelomonas sp. PFR6]